jgi:hypothetical protein
MITSLDVSMTTPSSLPIGVNHPIRSKTRIENMDMRKVGTYNAEMIMFLGLLIRTEPTKEVYARFVFQQSEWSDEYKHAENQDKEIRMITEMMRSPRVYNPNRIIS